MSKYASTEEYFRLTDSIQVGIHFQTIDHLFCSFASVHESLRNNTRAQNLVSLTKFLEKDSIRKTLSTNTDAFEHTIAPQLIQDQVIVDLPSTLIVIRNDTSNEVRLCTVQRIHE